MKKKTANLIFALTFVVFFVLGIAFYYVFFGDVSSITRLTDSGKNSSSSDDYNLADEVKDGTIMQVWCWDFKTITESMEDIAYAGFSTIQTSPINECNVGENGGMQLSGKGKWYYHYQPTDWTIGNYQLGTEEEFKLMCEEADKYGIKIIVDVVPNHTGPTGKISDNMRNLSSDVREIYHKNYNKSINNYGDRYQCTMYALTGLSDVNTELPAFQDYFIKYINRCVNLGVDGFRYDTAKHIALPDDPTEGTYTNNFWTRLMSEPVNSSTLFNYGEVLQGDNERLAEYAAAIGRVTSSAYGARIRSCISGQKLTAALLDDFTASGLSGDSLVTWVESHDNYLNDGTYKLSEDQIIFGWAMIAARGDGTPLFYSRPYNSSSTKDTMYGKQNRIGAAGSDFYMDERVVAINRLRNACVGEDTKLTNLDNPDGKIKTLLVSRGSKGAAIINFGSSFTISEPTSLADGTYTDRIYDETTFTVSGGTLSGTIPENCIIVLCNDSKYFDCEDAPILGVDFNQEHTIASNSTLDVKLNADTASNATYSINGGAETSYTDGQTITLNASQAVDGAIKVTLKAKYDNNKRTTTRTVVFTVVEN